MGRMTHWAGLVGSLALLSSVGCGGGGAVAGAQASLPVNGGAADATASEQALPATQGASGFTLTVAPETFAGAEPVALQLDLNGDARGVLATISAPAGAGLTALCARLDYDAELYTAADVEWLADFTQDEDCLKLTQLAIAGKAYLGCVPAGGGVGSSPAQWGSGGVSAADPGRVPGGRMPGEAWLRPYGENGGQGRPPHCKQPAPPSTTPPSTTAPESTPLARVRFTRGGCAGKGASAVYNLRDLITNEALCVTGNTLHWDTETIPSDYNEDGEVGFGDLLLIAQHYLERPTLETGYSVTYLEDDAEVTYWRFNHGSLLRKLDYIGNGEINQGDMLGLVADFGKRITEWRVYASLNLADYPGRPLAEMPNVYATPTVAAIASIPYAARDADKTSGNNYVAAIPSLPGGTYVWVRPWADDRAGTCSEPIAYNAAWFSGFRVEYDQDAMEHYGGLPKATRVDGWSFPEGYLLADIAMEYDPASISADETLLSRFHVFFNPSIISSYTYESSEDYNFPYYAWFNNDEHRNVHYNSQNLDFHYGEILCTVLVRFDNSTATARYSLQFVGQPKPEVPFAYKGILNCDPFVDNSPTTTWDQTQRALSWLYCGRADGNQDGWSNGGEEVMYAYLFSSFPPDYSDETTLRYLTDFNHSGELDSGDVWPLMDSINCAHDGYNMYYGPSSSNLTYAGHVALSEGAGNRYLERLRFTFQYPPEVQPGDALYYRPTLDGAEGSLAWLYTVPAG